MSTKGDGVKFRLQDLDEVRLWDRYAMAAFTGLSQRLEAELCDSAVHTARSACEYATAMMIERDKELSKIY